MSHTVRRRKLHKPHHHRSAHRSPAEAPAPEVLATAPKAAELVTDHAVLRYLERVTGIDVASQVRAEILADGRDQLIRAVGYGKIRIPGTQAVLQVTAGRVVTVKTRGAA